MQQKNTDIQVKDQLLQRKINGESVVSIAADTGRENGAGPWRHPRCTEPEHGVP